MGSLCACGTLRCLTPSALVFEDVDEASWFVGEAAVDPEWSKLFKNKTEVRYIFFFTTITKLATVS